MSKEDYLIDDATDKEEINDFEEYEDEESKFNNLMKNYEDKKYGEGILRSRLNNTEFGQDGLNASDMEIYQESRQEERHQEEMIAINNLINVCLNGKRFR